MIALAMEQARKELEAGTASSQVITHFLKLASTRNQVELEKLRLENDLTEEKILAAQAGHQLQGMVKEVLTALKSYTYVPPGMEDFDVFP